MNTDSDEIILDSLEAYDLHQAGFFVPSEQQAAIFACGLQRRSHIQVIARAGTGKTTTAMELLKLLAETPGGRGLKVLVIQFNKTIQLEAQAKLVAAGLDDFCVALTCHSLGNGALYRAYGKLQLDEYKTDHMLPQELPNETRNNIAKLVSICKNQLIGPNDLREMPDLLEDLALEYGVDLNGTAAEVSVHVPDVLRRSKENLSTIDFDDMIYLPNVLNLSVRHADLLIQDEAQDLNAAQQQLVMKAIGRTGRMVFIGDPKQAIYAFRGADHTSMDTMSAILQETDRGVESFPLTVTRRCPKAVVALAQQLVPDFQAHEDAPEGIVRVALKTEMPERGDMVLCRVNAPLVQMAYECIRKNIPAMIQGRDIGKGLVAVIKKLCKPYVSVDELMDKLSTYEDKERSRIVATNKNVERKLQALEDKCECIRAVSEGLDEVSEVIARIEQLFVNIDTLEDHSGYVLLSTVHKAKGMESPRVRVLRPDLMPHPMAKGKSALQEQNIAYVCATRAMQELVFHGVPRIFHLPEEPQTFKLGDKVRIIESGLEGVVADIDQGTSGQAIYDVALTDIPEVLPHEAFELELIAASPSCEACGGSGIYDYGVTVASAADRPLGVPCAVCDGTGRKAD